MTQILAFMLFGLSGAAGYGAARALLPHASRDRIGLLVTTLALAVGVLTQAMVWVALLLPGKLGPGSALVALVVLVAAGALVLRRRRPAESHEPSDGAPTAMATRALAVAALAVSVAILLGAVLWPFGDGDALAVYGPLGRVIAATGSLPVGEGLYEAYPMQVPMLYAAVEWLCGGPSEYLSRFLAAVLAVAGVAAAGWLARELRSARAGWLAAALLAACPVYCGWATTGYADIPAGFFTVLAAVFAWRWWRSRVLADAVLGGAAAGLALWTKNSTLTLLVSGPALAAAWWWADRTRRQRHDPRSSGADAAAPWRWSHIAAAAAAAAVVAAPFYVRNVVVFGFAVPATVWADRARHDLAGLLDPLRPEQGFGLLGWAGAATVAICLWRLIRTRGAAPAGALLVSVVAPFVAAWWWWASYDPRFLVTLLPVAAGFSGWLLDEAIEGLEARHLRHARWVAALVVTAVVIGTPIALRRAVEHKRELLAHPWMNDLERHRLQVGGLYELAHAINRLPAGVRVSGVPPAARYYLDLDRRPRVAWASANESPCAEAFDFHVLSPPARETAARAPCLGRMVLRTSDGYRLIRAAEPAGGEER